ncbi:MAG: hypothetical protein QOH56_4342 [Pseudonocardiales bacterium]|jgi:hypothetical protein|nr:hypothetical protein [Pseudonocardiales bacterium]
MSRSKHAARRRCDCGRPLGDEFLCKDCTDQLRRTLTDLPGRLAEVEDTACRQDTIVSQGDGGSSTKGKVRPLAYRPEVFALLHEARNVITTWVRDTADHRGIRLDDRHPILLGARCGDRECDHDTCRWIRRRGQLVVPSSTAALCGWLARHVDAIRLSPQASACAAAFAGLYAELLEVTDLPPIPIYLGPCDDCRRAMYVARGEEWHSCSTRGCKQIYHVDGRVDQLIRDSRNVVASPATIATALTSLDQPMTEERIRKWKERGWLPPTKHDTRGRPMYRVGDVLDLIEREDAMARKRAAAKLIGVSSRKGA